MKVGVCLPYMERELDRDTMLYWMRAIDNGPFESLTCGERITSYTVEMRTILGAAAAVTERVRIVPSLYVLPMHNAVWAAKEIATLDVMSNDV
ncbi:MAG: LLM class flavin-dependent oxidoreductase [Proteobacteria bacterium]|nr:LLM class flavin-dependent oxidoreductase [Pseudomonadota bacterium]